jgi:hypothetical protein
MFNIVHATLITKAKKITHERGDNQKRVKHYKIINFICIVITYSGLNKNNFYWNAKD